MKKTLGLTTKPYEIKKEHIDENKHLTHSIHPFYFGKARLKLFEKAGLDVKSTTPFETTIIISYSTYKYLQEITLEDKIVTITSHFEYDGGATFTIKQQMFIKKKTKPATIAKHECSFINTKTRKPIKPPKNLIQRIYEKTL